MNTNTLPRWASWTPATGTNELPLCRPLPPLAPQPTNELHLLDLLPRVEPLRQAWNSALTVAGAIGLIAVLAAFAYGTRHLGHILHALSTGAAL